jgi:HEAT repeat protein
LREAGAREAEATRAAVLDALRDEQEGVRVAAALALLSMGEPVAEADAAPLRQSDSAAERVAGAAIVALEATR